MKCPHCQQNIPTGRTGQQNRALHKNFQIIAQKLNDAGFHVSEIMNMEVDFTPEMVKEMWRRVQKRMYGKQSTTELSKVGEIEEIHETIMRALGQKGIEWHDFPSDPDKTDELKESLNYKK